MQLKSFAIKIIFDMQVETVQFTLEGLEVFSDSNQIL